MPLLLRHLMPLIVIGTMLLISIIFALTLLTVVGYLFRRKPPEIARGPIIEGAATEVRDEPAVLPAGGER